MSSRLGSLMGQLAELHLDLWMVVGEDLHAALGPLEGKQDALSIAIQMTQAEEGQQDACAYVPVPMQLMVKLHDKDGGKADDDDGHPGQYL